MNKYIPQEFEAKLVESWDKQNVYKTKEDKKLKNKMYTLVMFPYPSGAGLHVGHTRIYTGTDVVARYFRMKGYSVLHPMGWDAFGLPAENAAIKAKKNPMDIVPENIANFKRQMKMLGLSYDWNKELATTDPKYYAITQYLFQLFYGLGLLYKKNISVFFCPFCKTGLAEEEVLPNGTHERCGHLIEKKDLPQWIFKITEYGDSLLKSLNGLDWPDGILQMQRNWIGKKEGINITYRIKDLQNETITCFTTRPDTQFGATFVVIAPEHALVKRIIAGQIVIPEENKKSIEDYVRYAVAKTDVERQLEGRKKTGVFTGLSVINELNGRELPVWISDFVLGEFGTGAVVGVPGHDLRDFEFASGFGLPVIRVVVGKDGDTSEIVKKEQIQEEEGTMINSDFLNGMEIHTATEKMMDFLEAKGWGKRVVTYHLRDWIFSRQRYWGEPIPMVYCQKCAEKNISFWDTKDGKVFLETYQNVSKINKDNQKMMSGWFPIDQKNLPLELPHMKYYEPTETGESPLVEAKEWVKTSCPNCGSEARRETDTMPNWAGSCWYFLGYAFWNNDKKQFEFNAKKIEEWLPVDWYIGGAEHAVLHLLYARFWMHILNDMKIINFREPFKKLRNVGMVLAEDHRKMSKSFGNVINPDDVVAEYGADALRVYEMFMAPFNQEIAWSTSALQGAYRFLNRIWNIYQNDNHFTEDLSQQDKEVNIKLQKTIEKVGNDIADVKFNTAISTMMEFLNDWEESIKQNKKLSKINAKKFLQILAPFAPFMTEQIWKTLFKETESIHLSSWPIADISVLADQKVKLVVQVNGKSRGLITVNQNIGETEAIKLALADEKVNKYVGGSEYKTIYIKGKVLNFVIKH